MIIVKYINIYIYILNYYLLSLCDSMLRHFGLNDATYFIFNTENDIVNLNNLHPLQIQT